MTRRLTVQHILCPIDYSECSRRAMKRAVDLADWFGARVTALHVMGAAQPPLPATGLGGTGGLAGIGEDLASARKDDQAARLELFVEPWLGAAVPIETKVVEGGDLWRRIKDEAEALPADLIVMGTHGRSGLERVLVGSVTEKVTRVAPCPVMTVGATAEEGEEPLFASILCATDLAEAASPTVDFALSLASENLARVTLLHVVEELGSDRGADPSPSVPDLGVLRRTLMRQAQERLARLAAPARLFCDVRERVETGRAWREILRVAGETGADLIVVGAHSGGGLERLLLGSNANQVVRHAACPVLVVRDSYVAEEATAAHSGSRRSEAASAAR